jgi:hypothetical protein
MGSDDFDAFMGRTKGYRLGRPEPGRRAEEAARRELDRDAGGPVVLGRRRLPGEPTFEPDR